MTVNKGISFGGSILWIAASWCVSTAFVVEEMTPPNASLASNTIHLSQYEALANTDFSEVVDAPTEVMSAITVEALDDLPGVLPSRGYVAPKVGIKLGLPFSWNGKFMEAAAAAVTAGCSMTNISR